MSLKVARESSRSVSSDCKEKLDLLPDPSELQELDPVCAKMKKLFICLCLILVAAELSFARTRLGGRRGGKPTKRPIVQIRKDGPKDEDASQLVGQVTVDTDGLDEYEHPKLKKGDKDSRILGRYIAITNHSYSFFQVAGLLDTFYGAAQQRGNSFQIRGATTMSDAFQGFTAQMNKEALATVSILYPPFQCCMLRPAVRCASSVYCR